MTAALEELKNTYKNFVENNKFFLLDKNGKEQEINKEHVEWLVEEFIRAATIEFNTSLDCVKLRQRSLKSATRLLGMCIAGLIITFTVSSSLIQLITCGIIIYETFSCQKTTKAYARCVEEDLRKSSLDRARAYGRLVEIRTYSSK